MNDLKDTLQQMIDHHGLDRMLLAMSDVCSEKAELVCTNWQDDPLAQRWYTASVALDRVRLRIELP